MDRLKCFKYSLQKDRLHGSASPQTKTVADHTFLYRGTHIKLNCFHQTFLFLVLTLLFCFQKCCTTFFFPNFIRKNSGKQSSETPQMDPEFRIIKAHFKSADNFGGNIQESRFNVSLKYGLQGTATFMCTVAYTSIWTSEYLQLCYWLLTSLLWASSFSTQAVSADDSGMKRLAKAKERRAWASTKRVGDLGQMWGTLDAGCCILILNYTQSKHAGRKGLSRCLGRCGKITEALASRHS